MLFAVFDIDVVDSDVDAEEDVTEDDVAVAKS